MGGTGPTSTPADSAGAEGPGTLAAPADHDRLTRWEMAGLCLFAVVVLGHAVLTEVRSAFLQQRMTDVGVYFRAGWAARTGLDIYDVACDRGWHYNYPPLFAILVTPLGDPVTGADRSGFLPYAVSVGIFYAVNLAALALAVHWFARAFEETSSDPQFRRSRRFGRRWWALRIWPTIALAYPVGVTLGRGQVNHIVLALVGAGLLLAVRGRRFRAGAAVAAAIAIKVIPMYLLAWLVAKLDRRLIAGTVLGLIVTLGLVPAAYFGPDRTREMYASFFREVLAPGMSLTANEENSRQTELLGATATDHVGIVHAIHNAMHLGVQPTPQQQHRIARLVHVALGLLLTLAVVWPVGRSVSPAREVDGVALMLALMTILSPASHAHYLVFCLPMAMTLMGRFWEHRSGVPFSPPIVALCLWIVLTNVSQSLVPAARYLCLPLYGVLPMIGLALWRYRARLEGETSASAGTRVIRSEPRRIAA